MSNLIINKIGFVVLLFSVFVFFSVYGKFILFETTYLFGGRDEELKFHSMKKMDEKYVYYFKINNGNGDVYSSFPTIDRIYSHDLVQVRTSPIMRKVGFGKFSFLNFLVGVLISALSVWVSIIAILILFNVENSFTKRLKEMHRIGNV